MRSTSFVAFALCALSVTVSSAPTPQLTSLLGAITNPQAGAGNDNTFKDILNGNGEGNGNGNEAGNNNGNNNGNGNTVNVSPDVPITLPALPDVNISPTINLARSRDVVVHKS
ncbi:hypothetical protein IQ06DRAFT_379939 [Phaeosphaeriaceae sp. SRC1lsM3a]|nr:hypothetical protein IQ06DRAFT_379939 [Stagonospora sp. SRC1lsM3a]